MVAEAVETGLFPTQGKLGSCAPQEKLIAILPTAWWVSLNAWAS